MIAAYYNEIDPFAAQWLRNLIAAGHIAAGEVDTRSISEVQADDVRGFTQAHFFAGIGVWSHALRLAGWDDDRPVWTGSCPCQPFSAAGRWLGTADERHLWPEFHRLISECRPSIVLGEQVASALGREWLGAVRDGLEGVGYAVGAADLGAASVGAPHIRQRLWWVADASGAGSQGGAEPWERVHAQRPAVERDGGAGGVADAGSERRWKDAGGAFGDEAPDGRTGRNGRGADGDHVAGRHGADNGAGTLHGFWRDADWLLCRDGKWRPVEPGTFPLAHGAASRVGRLRAYGNAIVAPLAAEFIAAVMECRP